ncbi:MAG: epimerase [Gammaproteobacteria bacterium]|nr:epimerase [Gammaproteobacteria bacterium]|tara:strand:- start:143 stop:1078 length:936 start_codon:yes stop_codon:yes gene_type:complete
MFNLNKIVILGGTGFIGSELAVKMSKLSQTVVVLTRNIETNKDLKLIPNIELVACNIHDERSLRENFKNTDVVVNAVGILNEFGDNSFKLLHYLLIKKISAAMRVNKVNRLLHISSLNADIRAKSEYLRTKGKAEDYLLSETKDFCNVTIFRPSIVFGDNDAFFNKFATILRFSLVFPLACHNSKFMPVYIGDFTDFIISTVSSTNTYNTKINVTGPKEYTFREIIETTLRILKIKRIVIPLNNTMSKIQAYIFQRLPGKIFTMDNFEYLQVDSISTDGFKGTTSIEDIVPRYLNIDDSFKDLRKKSGRKQ